jgi:hypothetical protein
VIFERSFVARLLRRSVSQHAGDEARHHAERGDPRRLVELLPWRPLAGSSERGPTAVSEVEEHQVQLHGCPPPVMPTRPAAIQCRLDFESKILGAGGGNRIPHLPITTWPLCH